MRAMALTQPRAGALSQLKDAHRHRPRTNRRTVLACGVCRTDLHVVDGDLPSPAIPIIPGHEIVGRVERVGSGVSGFAPGDRVGIPWLGYSCGECEYCRTDRENLCRNARYTGYQIDGGYAEQAIADARFCFHLPTGTTTSTPRRCSARGSLATVHIAWLVMRSGSASMDSVRLPTSSRRWRCSMDARSTPL
jgi:propanol-preferring alcohol dehydrogenase